MALGSISVEKLIDPSIWTEIGEALPVEFKMRENNAQGEEERAVSLDFTDQVIICSP